MADNNTFPKVILKKKQIPVIVDFCIEESIEFSVKQQTFPDTDWEVELRIKEIKTAILVGMFLRENRLEMDGIDSQKIKKNGGKKNEDKSETTSKPEPAMKEEKESDVKSEESAASLM